MRGLFICTIFPTPARANHGLVNALQAVALSQFVELRVLCPHPYLPCLKFNGVPPAHSHRNYGTIPVEDIRALYVPFSKGAINGWLYSQSIGTALIQQCGNFQPDFLLTSFSFPDAVGVAPHAKRLGLPLVCILRGTDVHAYCKLPSRWRAIIRALDSASIIITRSQSLAAEVVQGGIAQERVHVVYNGVDHATFRLRDRNQTAMELGLPCDRRRILFVGNLLPVKLIPTLIEALAKLVREGDEQTDLYLLGEGAERSRLERLCSTYQLSERVFFRGETEHSEVAKWMSACDLVCLPSRNEGVPNVILEAFAAGKPVVASCVGGIPEVHPGAQYGALCSPGDVPLLAAKLKETLERNWDAHSIAGYAERFSWQANARSVWQLLQTLRK